MSSIIGSVVMSHLVMNSIILLGSGTSGLPARPGLKAGYTARL
jgi:hypothetical protein